MGEDHLDLTLLLEEFTAVLVPTAAGTGQHDPLPIFELFLELLDPSGAEAAKRVLTNGTMAEPISHKSDLSLFPPEVSRVEPQFAPGCLFDPGFEVRKPRHLGQGPYGPGDQNLPVFVHGDADVVGLSVFVVERACFGSFDHNLMEGDGHAVALQQDLPVLPEDERGEEPYTVLHLNSFWESWS